MKREFLAALALSFPMASSGLADMPVPFTYENFEAAIPHFDLETCPGQLAKEERFCRASFHHDEIHVFAFSENGDSPLVGFASFEAEGLETLLK